MEDILMKHISKIIVAHVQILAVIPAFHHLITLRELFIYLFECNIVYKDFRVQKRQRELAQLELEKLFLHTLLCGG